MLVCSLSENQRQLFLGAFAQAEREEEEVCVRVCACVCGLCVYVCGGGGILVLAFVCAFALLCVSYSRV